MLAAAAALPEGVAAKKGNNHDATKRHKRERCATAAAAAIAPVFISGLWHTFCFFPFFLFFPLLPPRSCAALLSLRRLTAVLILFVSDGDKNLSAGRIKCLSQKKINNKGLNAEWMFTFTFERCHKKKSCVQPGASQQ